jgi:hypothetical protein
MTIPNHLFQKLIVVPAGQTPHKAEYAEEIASKRPSDKPADGGPTPVRE